MADHFADHLLEKIAQKKSPICVGIDPILDSFPASASAASRRQGDSLDAAVDDLFQFCQKILEIVAPHVPCVKFQSAYFERYLWEGVEAYYSLVQYARELGLVVIGDVKRGDIGSTASAYAAGHLVEPPFAEMDEVAAPDAITVNPMLGMDTLEPFINSAKSLNKGLFVLVRTSNPGSAALQDVAMADGRTWSEALADHLRPLTEDPAMVGSSGWSAIGAVVGATQTHTIQSMRQRLPKSIFLLPGYGTQGATAEMTRAAFIDGRGALVSASRSILYAHRTPKFASQFGDDWEKCVEAAVLEMKQEISGVVGS
ncbi:MAG: orotidine-5'-phosphate decarboxylase [Phycisphaerales bacterium]|jgi:orotidine-5'-phosphate decarboxylase|nr:orotidine-5'-phosphate decarboxylase [Phycisphaerales bacterium]